VKRREKKEEKKGELGRFSSVWAITAVNPLQAAKLKKRW
jgi:hypothetical protein